MIVSQKISYTRILWTLGTPLASLTVWAFGVALIHHLYPENRVWVSSLPFTVAGAALSIFLGFRSNASYDRYWEGRTLWGRLVNYSRVLPRQLITYIRDDPEQSQDQVRRYTLAREQFIRRMSYRTIAFVHSLRHHLRGEDPMLEMRVLLTPAELDKVTSKNNVPNAILLLLGADLGMAHRRGWIDTIQLASLDATLNEFANIQGGCERIRNTPLPPAYTLITDRVVLIFCGLLPFGLVGEIGIFTPIIVAIVSFAFLILSRIGSLLENPFGMRSNDLPLTALSRTIEIDIRQSLDELDVPPPVEPIEGILL